MERKRDRLQWPIDRKTMPTEFGEYIVTQTSAGVLILSQKLPIADAIEALILVWEASTAEEWVNQIMSIPFWRVRESGVIKMEKLLTHFLLLPIGLSKFYRLVKTKQR